MAQTLGTQLGRSALLLRALSQCTFNDARKRTLKNCVSLSALTEVWIFVGTDSSRPSSMSSADKDAMNRSLQKKREEKRFYSFMRDIM